jgi:hypothetical protein
LGASGGGGAQKSSLLLLHLDQVQVAAGAPSSRSCCCFWSHTSLGARWGWGWPGHAAAAEQSARGVHWLGAALHLGRLGQQVGVTWCVGVGGGGPWGRVGWMRLEAAEGSGASKHGLQCT